MHSVADCAISVQDSYTCIPEIESYLLLSAHFLATLDSVLVIKVVRGKFPEGVLSPWISMSPWRTSTRAALSR